VVGSLNLPPASTSWGPGSCPTCPQQVQTCNWLVIEGPANPGCWASLGCTAKPQPVTQVQAAVSRQGGEDRQCQDGEVHTAAGPAHGVLGSAGVGTSVLALQAKGGISLGAVPSLGMGQNARGDPLPRVPMEHPDQRSEVSCSRSHS
jgi:hypothetical protein